MRVMHKWVYERKGEGTTFKKKQKYHYSLMMAKKTEVINKRTTAT